MRHLLSPIKFRPLDEGKPKSSGHKVMAKSNQEDLYYDKNQRRVKIKLVLTVGNTGVKEVGGPY